MDNFKVLDLLSGMGGRALGFQQAGFDVIYAIDKDSICKDVFCPIINNGIFTLSNIEDVLVSNLPDADVITAKLPLYTVSKASKRLDYKRDYEGCKQAILKIILNKQPKSFVLEIPSKIITNRNSIDIRNLLKAETFYNYSVFYQIFKEADFSGLPVSGNQAYIVGIRNDIATDEFYFPKGERIERKMLQEMNQDIDEWYRKIALRLDIRAQMGKYYVSEMGAVRETREIHTGVLKKMYVADSSGLRRFTHNEYAFLKGLAGYNFNKCSNKGDMYLRLAYASNVYIIKAIATNVKKYLEGVCRKTNSRKENSEKNVQVKIKKSKVEKGLSEDIIYPKQKIVNIHVDELKGLKNLDILLDKNLVAIMGVNGAGKSTILHALACAYKPYKEGIDYKFSFFFTPNPDSSWKNSRLSITYWDENLQKEISRVYRKDTTRWSPRYADRPSRDTYFIGIETCIPEIEREQQVSYIDYKTSLANDKISCKIITDAAYILNKNYDNLNYHKTKKKELFGVHTVDDRRYSSLSMGAGEQRVLKILKTVYTANAYSLILIDEIDILLHITAFKKMIYLLSEIALKRNLQIIFTTHSMEMETLQEFVDIRYLEPLKEKTMVYNTITPDIIYELSGRKEKEIKVYVEDILAETIVNVVAGDLGISRNIGVVKIGAASNAFVLAASSILQGIDTDNIFILLDGDVYRSEEDKKCAIKKLLTGTEKNHSNKVDKATALIHQLALPKNSEPEKYIFSMIIDLNDNNEITEIAKRLKAVNNSHGWLDELVTRMGKSEELILFQIVELIREHVGWEGYVKELRDWMIKQKEKIL